MLVETIGVFRWFGSNSSIAQRLKMEGTEEIKRRNRRKQCRAEFLFVELGFGFDQERALVGNGGQNTIAMKVKGVLARGGVILFFCRRA